MSQTAKAMWEVDPETRSKLLVVQKTNGNDRCCDCGAPSPQWASPKFSTFICLTCAGIHRGLGVHISFVRSITMDAFKNAEISRMEKGGNKPWKEYFDNHELTKAEGRSFDDCTILERYGGDVGEEWKEFLAAQVEEREFVRPERKGSALGGGSKSGSGRATPTTSTAGLRKGGAGAGSRSISSTPRSGSPAMGGPPTQKEKNEAYFAKLGSANATRPDDLPPSQGGKYAGFGSGPVNPPQGSSGAGVPGVDEFQRDPVAALTKGFGWFASTVGKSAKTVNDSYLQPGMKTIATSDFAAQARVTAGTLGSNLQTSARTATESFNRFVEGADGNSPHQTSANRRVVEPERKDFWDSFAAAGEEHANAQQQKPSAIGTSAMRRVGGGGGAATGTSTSTTTGTSGTAGTGKDKEDGWGDDW